MDRELIRNNQLISIFVTMASQLGDYFNIDFHWRGSNNVDMIINPARTQQFSSGTSSLSTLLQYIKDTFYLDDVIGFQANKDGVNYHGFWGTCIVGGANEVMHKSTRIVEIHSDSLAQSKRTFNDAGLNTKAFIQNFLFTLSYANRARVPIKTISSYFDNSIRIGYYYRKLGDTTWLEQTIPNSSRMPAKTNITETERLFTAFSENTTYQFKFFIENPEGIYEAPIHNELMLFFVYDQVFRIRPAVCSAVSGEQVLHYDTRTKNGLASLTETSVSNDFFAYVDEDMTIEPTSGFYVGEDDYTYYYNNGIGFQFKTYCKAPDVIKVILSMIIKPDLTWSLTIQRTEFLPQWQDVTISGSVFGRLGSSDVAFIPFTISLAVGQNSNSTSGTHDVDNPYLLDWSFGNTFTITSNGEINNTNISGFAGAGS